METIRPRGLQKREANQGGGVSQQQEGQGAQRWNHNEQRLPRIIKHQQHKEANVMEDELRGSAPRQQQQHAKTLRRNQPALCAGPVSRLGPASCAVGSRTHHHQEEVPARSFMDPLTSCGGYFGPGFPPPNQIWRPWGFCATKDVKQICLLTTSG